MNFRRLLLSAALLTTLSLHAQPVPLVAPPAPDDPGAQELRRLIDESRLEELRWSDFTDYRKHLINFYAPRAYAPVWTEGNRARRQAFALIELFKAADAKGIRSEDYDAARWAARLHALSTASPALLSRFDVQMTATLMRYISDLHIGRINPRNIAFDLDIEQKKYYLPTLVGGVVVADDVNTILDHIEPPYDDYRKLSEALKTYARLAAAGDQPPLPLPAATVDPGAVYPSLAPLAAFLKRVGDLPPQAAVDTRTNLYSGAVVDAVRRFQKRHGLDADGRIGKGTVTQLNVPLSRRAEQIRMAMERWRWVPSEFTTAPIVVNIPEFRLSAWDSEMKPALTMNVVVGKAFRHETPVFQSDMKYIVIHPYWNVPPSIQRAELAPALAKNPGYAARNDLEIVDGDENVVTNVTPEVVAGVKSLRYTLRQKPGDSNALGRVKFMFPNPNNIYLHDTPSRSLFTRSRRDFSHGCIRVGDPLALAKFVLRKDPQWPAERVEKAFAGSDDNLHVILKERIPVLILYTTAKVEADGAVHFFEDIYGHDATLENALAMGYPYPA